MKRFIVTILAGSGLAAVASAAEAQDGYMIPPPPPPVAAYPAATGYNAVPAPVQPAAPVQYHESYYQAAPAQYHSGPGLPPMPTVGYTIDERDAWLDECRATYSGEGRRKGGIIGGLLGAIGGGILGHEVTDGSRTRRIGGTLVGAGVGGLAGLAIGAAIGGAGDDRIDECEAYLRQYTGGYGHGGYAGGGYAGGAYQYGGYNYGYGYHGYTTVMVPVQVQSAYSYSAPIRREQEFVTEEVVYETVEVEKPRTKYVKAPATKYVKQAPATTKYAKDKRVRYAK